MASSKKRKLTKLYRARVLGDLNPTLAFDEQAGYFDRKMRRWRDSTGWVMNPDFFPSKHEAILREMQNLDTSIRSTVRSLARLMRQRDAADLRRIAEEVSK